MADGSHREINPLLAPEIVNAIWPDLLDQLVESSIARPEQGVAAKGGGQPIIPRVMDRFEKEKT